MGRKKKEIKIPVDRIGEPISLEKCPECDYHPDCFAWINGKCTALNTCDGEGCIFYKPIEVAMEENRRAYKSLRKRKRFDLIEKYTKPLMALGVFDEAIEAASDIADELEKFRKDDYERAWSELEVGNGYDDTGKTTVE